uniref:Selenoprotein O n=1 Tax=Leptobrachium leishanense TaxID=445787 RepID=A0A8C5PYG9_9ANUR
MFVDFPADLPVDRIRTNHVRRVHNCIFSQVYPTPFVSNVQLVAVSEDVLDNLLDLDICVVKEDNFLRFVSGERIAAGFVPLAHRYGGHQFGVWAGQLGDGRAHLVGAYINRFGERWELQLKGSGRTPYSRSGDGRAVLRSSVREFLCSEAMHYLGVPTSRAASLVVSDDAVWRDQFYNGNVQKERGAVVLRVAKSWFRIGSLEILTQSREYELLSLLSITIDYGPFGFMEDYDVDYVPNTSDDEGRYRIGNQANAGMFNLNKLLLALNPLMDGRQRQLFKELFSAKLGLLGETEQDFAIIALFLNLLEDTRADFTMAFRDLSEITEEQLQSLSIPQEYWALSVISKHTAFPEWVNTYIQRLKRYVLRNWMAESATRKSEQNDFSEVRLLQRILSRPFHKQKLAESAGYADRAPAWANDLKVSCSS